MCYNIYVIKRWLQQQQQTKGTERKMKEYIITGYNEGREFTPILIYAKDYTEAYLNACYKLPQGATINKVIEVNG